MPKRGWKFSREMNRRNHEGKRKRVARPCVTLSRLLCTTEPRGPSVGLGLHFHGSLTNGKSEDGQGHTHMFKGSPLSQAPGILQCFHSSGETMCKHISGKCFQVERSTLKEESCMKESAWRRCFRYCGRHCCQGHRQMGTGMQ